MVQRLGAGAALAALPWLAWQGWQAARATWGAGIATVDDALVAAGASTVAAVSAYLLLASLLEIVGHLTRSRLLVQAARSLAPRAWRAVTASLVGAGLTLGIAGPGIAAEAPPPIGFAPPPAAAAVENGALADSTPTDAEAPTAEESPEGMTTPVTFDAVSPSAPSAPAASIAEATHVVAPGDSLWAITADLLGEGASDADIAQWWPQLYEANRDVIGANPSLIHPGQELAIPGGLR